MLGTQGRELKGLDFTWWTTGSPTQKLPEYSWLGHSHGLPSLPTTLPTVPGDPKTELSCVLSLRSTSFVGHTHLCPSPPRSTPNRGRQIPQAAWGRGNP